MVKGEEGETKKRGRERERKRERDEEVYKCSWERGRKEGCPTILSMLVRETVKPGPN